MTTVDNPDFLNFEDNHVGSNMDYKEIGIALCPQQPEKVKHW